MFGVLRILPPENAVEGCWYIEQLQVRRIRCRIRRTFFAENRKVLEELVREIRPDMLFMPHGNDTNRAHRAMYAMMKTIAASVEWPVAMMMNSDVKTVEMKKEFYLAFDDRQAQWKSRLLRYHDSQHQRNLRDRGYGFDDRVLGLNRRTASGLGIGLPYAASFELELYR